jgi:glycine/D-amino acid oxidase-like deaminating enzyme
MRARDFAIVVGGGFFGCELAIRLARTFESVAVLEAEADIMRRASFGNQARVHNGYHYPRSMLTALRSRANYPRFCAEYSGCIDARFRKIYAVARRFSKVGAGQFAGFCRRIGAPCEPLPRPIRALFDGHEIEDAFAVDECAFDADRLRELVRRRLRAANVSCRCGFEVRQLRSEAGRRVVVEADGPKGRETFDAAMVVIATYGSLNALMEANGLPPIPVKHELAELALIEVPAELRSVGITVMCGPFFSCMPFPARGLHSLSHVRFTPHAAWPAGSGPPRRPRSNADLMLRDAARFVPALRHARYVDSLWEIKCVPTRNESDDGRPILWLADHGMPNLHCVLGSKIDNVYDALDHLDRVVTGRKAA